MGYLYFFLGPHDLESWRDVSHGSHRVVAPMLHVYLCGLGPEFLTQCCDLDSESNQLLISAGSDLCHRAFVCVDCQLLNLLLTYLLLHSASKQVNMQRVTTTTTTPV